LYAVEVLGLYGGFDSVLLWQPDVINKHIPNSISVAYSRIVTGVYENIVRIRKRLCDRVCICRRSGKVLKGI